jgi:hypothetical protein
VPSFSACVVLLFVHVIAQRGVLQKGLNFVFVLIRPLSLLRTTNFALSCALACSGGASALTKTGRADKWTTAHCACRHGHTASLEILATSGASASFTSFNSYGDSCAILAARGGHDECLALIAKHGAPEALTATGRADKWTPAHFAARNGRATCLEILAKSGAALTFTAINSEGDTPAILAAHHGHAHCLQVDWIQSFTRPLVHPHSHPPTPLLVLTARLWYANWPAGVSIAPTAMITQYDHPVARSLIRPPTHPATRSSCS